jgi:Tol biopolymer transport system component
VVKRIQSFLSNFTTLVLLLALVLGLVLFFSRIAQRPAQAPDSEPTPSPLETATLLPDTKEQATPGPAFTAEVDPTLTAVPAEPQDDRPEPTWTPVIILPDATSPPDPTPVPTPTATPINPGEELLLELKSLAGQLAISPDDQEIAFNQLSPDRSQNQLWKFHLTDKQLTKLSEFGGIPEWSPDGQAITFLRRYWDDPKATEATVEIRLVTRDGKSEKILVERRLSEVLDYYWATSDRIELVSPSGVENVDQTGEVTQRVNLVLPAKVQNGSLPPQVDGSSGQFVVLNENPPLQVIDYSGDHTIIVDPKGRSIGNFSLSPDKQYIAYIVIDGPIEELWVTDLTGKEQHSLFELPGGGSITTPRWSPDGKLLAIGHRPTGTYYADAYELALIDVNTGQVIDLNVDQVNSGFVWSNDGRWLYYTRPILVEPPETYDVTLYRLGIEQ